MRSSRPDAGHAQPPARGEQTFAGLRELQRQTARAIFRPLGPGFRTKRRWTDGRPARQVIAEFIKPNDRLSSLERLELYNKQYWFRLLDCLYDDYPGLRTILGERRFYRLRVAYLERHPSTSFTLRNLGSRLEQFLQDEPLLTVPHQAMCLDMARFEWAQIVAFDGEAKPALSVDDLLGRNPARLKLGVQPYITFLEISYPLDDFVLAVKKRSAALRSEASNAKEGVHKEKKFRRPPLSKPAQTFLAVHRWQNDLYYKRLLEPQYRLLIALRDGATLEAACERAAETGGEQIAEDLQRWFHTWMELGWFTKGAS